jgi:hypothetical protein
MRFWSWQFWAIVALLSAILWVNYVVTEYLDEIEEFREELLERGGHGKEGTPPPYFR